MDGPEASNTLITEGQGPWMSGQEWLATMAAATTENLLEIEVPYKEVQQGYKEKGLFRNNPL
jgi:hypothetical protein